MPWPSTSWEAGTEHHELRRLVAYWSEEFDWEAQQYRIAALPWQTAHIGEAAITYLRFDAETEGGLPVVLTNGWPSTALELVELAERLAMPSQFGGNPDDAVTVIVPALPGLPFSPQRPTFSEQAHELWHLLMTDHLGFTRYAAHGGDLGAGITSRLAQAYPEEVAGIHLLAVAAPRQYDQKTLTTEERQHLARVEAWAAAEGAYQHQQQTRPLTLASVYWFTNSIGTSLRPYYEFAAGFTTRVERVEVPIAIALSPGDLASPPRSWAEQTYDVRRFTRMPRGGHFAPHEEPKLLADDIMEFLRALCGDG